MNIQNFAQLKRALTVGTKIKLIDSSLKTHKHLGQVRAVIKQQTNAVKLEGGSWLDLGSMGVKAGNFSFQENGFTMSWHEGKDYLRYEFV